MRLLSILLLTMGCLSVYSNDYCKVKVEKNENWIMCQGCSDRWYGKMNRIVGNKMAKRGYDVVSKNDPYYDYILHVTKEEGPNNQILTTASLYDLSGELKAEKKVLTKENGFFFNIADRNGTRRSVLGLSTCDEIQKLSKINYASINH
ncbi:hypothetical protein N9N67_09535 [Bacteriovoracaceae bacterium]|nr:hypothetical protein [Bacteriovoracaceae bacterium]